MPKTSDIARILAYLKSNPDQLKKLQDGTFVSELFSSLEKNLEIPEPVKTALNLSTEYLSRSTSPNVEPLSDEDFL